MRIRSIRPEFLTDPKILDLEDGTAFFYVCLWMACDDAGYFEIDTRSIAAKVARWRPQEVFKHLRRLNEEGMVKVSSTDGVGLVEAWSRHQRMVKPQRSKWEGKEIRWDNVVRPRKKNACRVEESRVEESRVEDFAGSLRSPRLWIRNLLRLKFGKRTRTPISIAIRPSPYVTPRSTAR